MSYDDFAWYRGSVPWLKDRTIFLTKHGSQAYGTNLPTSDVDLKGIAVAPKEYYLGNLNRFEQAENKGGLDVVIYGINKFVDLASNCNPNIIEVLCVDESDWILSTWAWDKLHDSRALFLSKRAQYTFSGYAMSQLNRIRSHRRWLLEPPKAQPQRQDFGLPQNDPTIGKDQLNTINAAIKKEEDKLAGEGWTKDRVENKDEQLVDWACEKFDINRQLIPVIINERRYSGAMRNWNAFLQWKEGRNPARAALEAQHGYDTKHAMHLVRLMTMAGEILREGTVHVKRPDASVLLDIRHGKWTYDQLIAWAQQTEAGLVAAAAESKLPREPDRVAIDRVLMDIVQDVNFNGGIEISISRFR